MRRTALTLLLLALLAVPAAASARRGHHPRPWACNGSARLCGRAFDQVVLPGAHNAMSNAADGWAIPNQQVGIPSQLKDGIRAFLIDTHYGHPDGTGKVITDKTKTPQSVSYLCHEACEIGATRLKDSLATMRRFLQRHPHNVLLLDVEDYVSTTDFADVARITGLSRYVYRRDPLTAKWPTLRWMIRHHQQVVILDEHQATGVPWIHLDYQGIVQETNYNWNTPDLITDPAKWPASCAPNRGGTTGSLFLMNHWSPPVAPDPAKTVAVNAKDVLVGRARACEKARGKLPTIVAVDMYRSGDLFGAVRELNGLRGS